MQRIYLIYNKNSILNLYTKYYSAFLRINGTISYN